MTQSKLPAKTPKKKTSKKRKRYDWEAIFKDLRANQVSKREVARRHGVDYGYMTREAKKHNVQPDLSNEVRAAARRKLVSNSVSTGDANEIIEEKSDELVQIVRLHRKDIQQLRRAEIGLLAELLDNPTKLWIGQYQGNVVTKEVSIPVTERSAALAALAKTRKTRIILERQAYGLDEADAGVDDTLDIPAEEKKLFRKAARILSRHVIKRGEE